MCARNSIQQQVSPGGDHTQLGLQCCVQSLTDLNTVDDDAVTAHHGSCASVAMPDQHLLAMLVAGYDLIWPCDSGPTHRL